MIGVGALGIHLGGGLGHHFGGVGLITYTCQCRIDVAVPEAGYIRTIITTSHQPADLIASRDLRAGVTIADAASIVGSHQTADVVIT